MKKVIGMALAALLIICCGSHQTAVGTNTKSNSSKLAPAKALKHLEAGKSAKYYLDYARWGNTDGYLNLARCYRDGIGVERNFYRSLALITTLQSFDGKFDIPYPHGLYYENGRWVFGEEDGIRSYGRLNYWNFWEK